MFDATKDDLIDILEDAAAGKIQLPEFQRDYVWGDDDVRSLLASVAQGFPIGAILTLETGGEVEFKPRPLEGIVADQANLQQYLLDGQQRITSLSQALFSDKPIDTLNRKGKKIQRFYYLDIKKAINTNDLDTAIIGVPADRIVRENFGRDEVLNLSTPELEFEHCMFPLNRTFDNKRWLSDWRAWHKEREGDVDDLERAFDRNVLSKFERYEVPIIQLKKENGRAAICQVFEKVNVGGKKLDAFELVTAIYAGSDFDLREDWFGAANGAAGRKERIAGEKNRRDVVSKVASTDFLQACAVIQTRAVRLTKKAEGMDDNDLPAISCRRDAILSLTADHYRDHADVVEEGFKEASRFLNEHKIISYRDVPYPPQIVTLAAAFGLLGKDGKNDAARTKLSRWFWCTTFGELYGSSTESRIAFDVPELVNWVADDKAMPRSVEQAVFQKSRLLSLRTRVSAAYKGVHANLMNLGCLDFVSGKPADIATFHEEPLDIHHIFPQAWCKRNGIEPAVFNSIVNKTPLSKRTNVRVGGNAPSQYLASIEANDGIAAARLDEILETHLIDPALLRNDDFQGFFEARMTALSETIGNAMGKAVVDIAGSDEAEIEIEETTEEQEAA